MLAAMVDNWCWIGLAIAVFSLSIVTAAFLRRITAVTGASSYHGATRYLDGLRAGAALLVVAGHSVGPLAWLLGNRNPLALVDNFGSVGVQIFFAISGYLFTRKILQAPTASPAAFFRGRLRRIMPLYLFIVSVSTGIVLIAGQGPFLLDQIWRPVLKLFFFGVLPIQTESIRGVDAGQVIGTIWTLRCEWLFYLCVPLLAFALTSRRMVVATLVIVTLYGAATIKVGSTDNYWLFFIPGITLAVVGNGKMRLSRSAHVVLTTALVVLFGAVLLGPVGYTLSRFFEMFAAFALLVELKPKILYNQTLGFLGDISYSLYLVHFPVMFLGESLVSATYQTVLTSTVSQIAVELGCVVIAVGLSCLTYRFIELPFIRRREATEKPPVMPVEAPTLSEPTA